ncbi:MAG: peptide ABC transporter permease [Candidatus Meridianibacter frigidus]|nr:MAG: peptide ABC transporter permease [Candidatus Eremiobacteraeota bacterium]
MAASVPINQPLVVDEERFEVSKNTVWRRFRKHKLALLGIFVLGFMILVSIFAKQLAPYDPNWIDKAWQGSPLPPTFVNAHLSAHHALGTDEIGRDLLSRLIFGARISLTVGVAATLMEVLIGTFLGAISGYYGGWIDYIIMRVTDVFLSIPILPLLLVLTAIVAAKSSRASLSFGIIVIIIGGLAWPPVARLVRATFLSLREREYTEAARAVGNNDMRIIFRHLLPNSMAPIIVQATLDVAGVIILESTLSFLGFGIQPPTASWGNMLSNAISTLQTAWWAAVFPGLCILVTVLAINYMGDGLRDALDPNTR